MIPADGLTNDSTLDGAAAFAATIHLPIAKNPLSLNSRDHWAKKAKHTKRFRQFAAISAARFPTLPACDVTLTWFVTTSHRRDEDNMFPLLKALCDGLVDAGVTTDDTPDLMGKACRIERAPKGCKTAYMELRVVSRQVRS